MPHPAEANLPNPQVASDLPQLATVALVADEAGVRMAGEEKLNHGSPRLDHFGRFSIDHHSRGNGGDAGCQQGAVGFVLDKANSAGTYRFEMGIVAKGENRDAFLLS
jgi:hypothetical protein